VCVRAKYNNNDTHTVCNERCAPQLPLSSLRSTHWKPRRWWHDYAAACRALCRFRVSRFFATIGRHTTHARLLFGTAWLRIQERERERVHKVSAQQQNLKA
jgi:hypothetical protein